MDNCCFNRPFDDQSQARIRIEAEAKLEIQRRVRGGEIELAWSYVLDFENDENPFEERRAMIGLWRAAATVDLDESADILREAHEIAKRGLRAKDSLHVACAIAAGCDHFLTTDDLLLKKARELAAIAVIDPVQFIREVAK